MHDFHVDRWKYVIDKTDVILSKCATIHQIKSLHDWFASRYPTAWTRFQSYLPNSKSARGILPREQTQKRYRQLSRTRVTKKPARIVAPAFIYPYSELSGISRAMAR